MGPINNISSIGSDNGLAPDRRQAIISTNGGLAYWRIYGSLVLNVIFVEYRQVSNIRHKIPALKDSHTVLRLSLPNPLKQDVTSRMKM